MYIMRNLDFEALCSLTQEEMVRYVTETLNERGRPVEAGDGYIYSAGEIPVLICAHMDTVHRTTPKVFFYSTDGSIINSPQGIGGDDRCGIYMILNIIENLNCHVAFFKDEEVGGTGSRNFAATETCLDMDVRYVIELDRMNANDAVFYHCDNPEFTEFITQEFWKTSWGSFTDICHICPAMRIAGVNLSCGYYNQHMASEYVVLPQMSKAIEEVIKLIRRTDYDKTFEYIERKYSYKHLGFSSYSSYDDLYDDVIDDDDIWFEGRNIRHFKSRTSEPATWLISCYLDGKYEHVQVEAISRDEAIGQFSMDYPEGKFLSAYKIFS